MSPIPARLVAIFVACAATSAGAAIPDPVAGEASFAARWARHPTDDTWVAGLEWLARRGTLSISGSGDAMRMRDPRPGADDAGMLLVVTALGHRIAGDARAALYAEGVGSLFLLAVGDVGIGAPGVGAGLTADWRMSPTVAIAATARLTVPLAIMDATVALRAGAGPLALTVGWRDVRFIPVFGTPGRHASGPQLALAVPF